MRAQSSFGIVAYGNVISSSINEMIDESVNKVLVLDRSIRTLSSELEVVVPDLGVVHTSYVSPNDGLYGQRVSAVVVIGSSPVRAVDAGSIQFFESLRDLLFKSIALLSLSLNSSGSTNFSLHCLTNWRSQLRKQRRTRESPPR
jgi:hypothetical protein